MSLPIEDYALISDCNCAALVSREGSIDWLCFPNFDSAACFASLLGTKEHGRWQISPAGEFKTKRNYIEDTVVLETYYETSTGSCRLTDCMLMDDEIPTLVRIIEGQEGVVDLELELIIRFDYGSIVPWVRKNLEGHGINAIAGPEGVVVHSPIPLVGEGLHTKATFKINSGEKIYFVLYWYQSNTPYPLLDPYILNQVEKTISKWKSWAKKGNYDGFDRESVKRSLLTLKSLTYTPTGAIVAAPTMALPEELGGTRNWDYRYSWVRDSSYTLYALLSAGYKKEAEDWTHWLSRAIAGTPSQVNIMYGIRGERRLTEIELDWLPGYENSSPVRLGNAAYKQLQLDIFGELIYSFHLGRQNGIHNKDNTWRLETNIVNYVCDHWRDADEGIWEVRGPKRQFTHSKLMAWLSLDCAISSVQKFNGPTEDLDRWIRLRDTIHRDVCEQGFNKKLNSFVQTYGSPELDASLLMLPILGFLPATDPRIVGTVEAIQKNLMCDGLILRYKHGSDIDGLQGAEGCFIACSFWLVRCLILMKRQDEALELYKHLQTLRNDLGLFSEEYDIKRKRLIGNFPQAFSHTAQVNAAMNFKNVF